MRTILTNKRFAYQLYYWVGSNSINIPLEKNFFDTIVAIATPPGEGGVGIIRLSGPKAKFIVKKIATAPHITPLSFLPNYLHTCLIKDQNDTKTIDQALCVFFQGPKSYTGEDIVEIHAHGGQTILQSILALCVQQGARIAEPGEFTKRAFLNGKLDLTQAEAVIDVIRAKSERASRIAVSQLEGGLSKRLNSAYDALLFVLAYLEATFDFVDDDIPDIPSGDLQARILEASSILTKLAQGAKEGLLLQQGATVALIGLPNAGKSSLFNALLQHDRSIVTAIAGTTRDTVEEYCLLEGIAVRLIDTAGITRTEDVVEKIGVEKSLQKLRSADVLLLLFDGSDVKNTLMTLKNELPAKIWEELANKGALLVCNKEDLVKESKKKAIITAFKTEAKHLKISLLGSIWVSAKEDRHIDALQKKVSSLLLGTTSMSDEDVLITNTRHLALIQQVLPQCDEIAKALASPSSDLSLLTITLRSMLDTLGQITGKVVTEDLLSNIFGRFCVGKRSCFPLLRLSF